MTPRPPQGISLDAALHRLARRLRFLATAAAAVSESRPLDDSYHGFADLLELSANDLDRVIEILKVQR